MLHVQGNYNYEDLHYIPLNLKMADNLFVSTLNKIMKCKLPIKLQTGKPFPFCCRKSKSKFSETISPEKLCYTTRVIVRRNYQPSERCW